MGESGRENVNSRCRSSEAMAKVRVRTQPGFSDLGDQNAWRITKTDRGAEGNWERRMLLGSSLPNDFK
jgi:hypothetical protein